MAASFEGLHGPVLEVLRDNEWAFRTGIVKVGDARFLHAEKRPFDAEYITERLNFPAGRTPRAVARAEYATTTITRVLECLAEDPNNHIVLRRKTMENPDVIHIDTIVLEFIRSREFDVIMESPGFDAAFIAEKLGLNQNFVACALRRIVGDVRFIGLLDKDSNNPKPIRDYGVSRDTKYAAAVR